jgi:acyl carrier protein
MTEVEQKVIAAVANALGASVSEVLLQSSLEDLGADDIDRVAIAMELEDEFEIDLEDLDTTASSWKTVQDIVVSFASK